MRILYVDNANALPYSAVGSYYVPYIVPSISLGCISQFNLHSKPTRLYCFLNTESSFQSLIKIGIYFILFILLRLFSWQHSMQALSSLTRKQTCAINIFSSRVRKVSHREVA